MKDIEGSSNIEAFGHEGTTLSVRFKGGAEYTYENVPPELHQKFMEAESKGSFFHANIKTKFEGKRKKK